MQGITVNDIVTLGDLPSYEMNNLLRRNNIYLSTSVLNKILKLQLIEKINVSDDLLELREDTLMISRMTNLQLISYAKSNYIDVEIDTFMANLWSLVLDANLNIPVTDIKMLLNKKDVSLEFIDDVFSNLTQFVDDDGFVDGLTFIEAKRAYVTYSTLEDLNNFAKKLNIKIPKMVDYNTLYKRILKAIPDKNYGGLENLSYDSLLDYVKQNSLNINTDLEKEDIIKYFLTKYPKNSVKIFNVDLSKIKLTNLSKVDKIVKERITKPVNNKLKSTIDDILKSETDDSDAELDAIIDEIDKDDEAESYDFNGVFDKDLISSVIEDHPESQTVNSDINFENKKVKSAFDESLVNSIVNDSKNYSDETKVKDERPRVVKNNAGFVNLSALANEDNTKVKNHPALKTVTENEEQVVNKEPLDTPIEIKELKLDVKPDAKMETVKENSPKPLAISDILKDDTLSKDKEKSSKQLAKEAKKDEKKAQKEAKKRKKPIVSKSTRPNKPIYIVLIIWFILMILLLLFRIS